MKLAVITDTTAVLSDDLKAKENLFVLDIPIMIGGVSYVEGKDLSLDDFYKKMAMSPTLPKTSQPSLVKLDEILTQLSSEGYTHVVGLFLSSGISGFWQNIQFLIEDYPELTIAFPDSKITSAPLGSMVKIHLIGLKMVFRLMIFWLNCKSKSMEQVPLSWLMI